jgi:glycerate kinase
MRIVVAPDKFAGTLSAVEAAEAIMTGWRRTAPQDQFDLVPLADGGPGFLDVLQASLGGDLIAATVTGPLRAAVPGAVLLVGTTAYIESAQACGLHLMPADSRDPSVSTSYGVGELIAVAVATGATEVIIGLGGSGTNDGGAGLLAALGATALDAAGQDVTELLAGGGLGLRQIVAVELTAARAAIHGVRLVAASDVDNPLLGLRGATNGFGPQKGATVAQIMALEGSLESFSKAIGRVSGKDPAVQLGSGAAGGLGYALLVLGAQRAAGIGSVLAAVGLADLIGTADVVITGEGCFDWQSLRGKVVAGVAALALEQARPCLVLAGRVEVGRREYAASGVSGCYAVVDDLAARGIPEQAAFEHPADRLADLAERAARTWSR